MKALPIISSTQKVRHRPPLALPPARNAVTGREELSRAHAAV